MKTAQAYGSLEWLANAELSNASELSIARMIVAAGATSEAHSHPNCEEAAYVIRGEVEEVIDGRIHILRTGVVAVAARGAAHFFRNVCDTEAEVLIVFSSADRAYEPQA